MPTAMKHESWTAAELDACVKVYLEMLSKEISQVPYRKSDYRNQTLAQALNKRTAASFEYRMQNISHVLNTLRQKYIKGYVPAKNVGRNTFDSICKSLERNNFIIINDFEPTVDIEKLNQSTNRIRKGIDLKNKPTGQQRPQKTETTTTIYYRDPIVRAWVLENAKGKCEACDLDAPFLLSDDVPFLEVHHMIPLAAGGPDTVENAVALCPNCHRRSHLSKDKDSFNNKIYSKVKRLIKY